MKNVIILALLFMGNQLLLSQDKPNIIFILTDDQRWDAIGYSGNEVIQTPEMDKLAAEGCYFSNAMVTTPICAASRASIFSGLHERKHKYTFQTGGIRSEYMDDSYPYLLREAGYYTGFYKKFGVNYKEKEKCIWPATLVCSEQEVLSEVQTGSTMKVSFDLANK